MGKILFIIATIAIAIAHVSYADTCTASLCGEPGTACDKNTNCKDNTHCINGICTLYKEGDPCKISCDDAAKGQPHMYCNTSGICVRYPKKGDACTALTNPCDPDDDSIYCDPSDKVCKEYPGKDEKCNILYGCKSGLYCDGIYCKSLIKEGEACTLFNKCEDGLFCNGTICRKPYGLGESCFYNYCYDSKEKLYCNYTSGSTPGKCRLYPKENEDCEITRTCYSDDLYCEAKGLIKKYTCKKLPTKGEECTSEGYCAAGLYAQRLTLLGECTCVEKPKYGERCSLLSGCDNSTEALYCNTTSLTTFSGYCNRYPEKGEACLIDGSCRGNLKCGKVVEGKTTKHVCMDPVAKTGEFCSETDSLPNYYITCEKDNRCLLGVCGKPKNEGDTCLASIECDYPSYFCLDNKCTKAMSLSEGDKCWDLTGAFTSLDESEDNDGVFDDTNLVAVTVNSLQCKKGLACVPKSSSTSEFYCTKVKTSIKDEKVCDGTCPVDTACDCNDKSGKEQCVPYPTSENWVLDDYKDLFNEKDLVDKAVKYANFAARIYEEFFPYKTAYRCSMYSAAAGISASSLIFIYALIALIAIMF